MEKVTELHAANPAPVVPAPASADGILEWQQRVILGKQVGGMELPAWLHDAYATLRVHVMDPAYPCFFGTMAEKRGEMFYSYVNGKDIAQLAQTMTTFSELAKLPAYEKNNIAIFFEPDAEPLSHQQYHDHFWDILQHLHDHDPDPEADHQPPPDDPKWEFAFAGVEMFVVCACPSFGARHSRNLGPGMVLLFQPRSVFVDKVTNRVIGLQAREEVRRRLKKWDAIPAHPDLGFYGDPGNLEWKQYFLPDDNIPAAGKCPFLSRSTSIAAAGADAHGRNHEEVGASAPAPIAEPRHHEKMREISERYASLPADKRKVFRAALEQKQIPVALLPVTPLAGRGERMPLSYAQERLWFLWKMAPNNSAYNMPNTVQLDGELDQAAVFAAIRSIVARHEILRTTFEQAEDTPWQVIHAEPRFDWSVGDWRDEPPAVARERLTHHLRSLSLQAFDLEQGPLLRVALIRLEEKVHVLHFVLHHIVGDAWSHAVLGREFAAAYGAARAGRDPLSALPALRLQYADIAAWQKEWADEPAMDQQLAYWKQRLGGEHPVLALPTERQRDAAATADREGRWVTREIAAPVLTRLKHMADEYGITLFTVLLATYDALLYRYSGQRDIRVGVPVAGRGRSETQDLIGFFVNTLVLRAELDGADRFDHLLNQVQTRMLEAQSNQDLPFARLVDALQPERSLDSTPLFQVMFNHAAKGTPGKPLDGLRVSAMESDQDSVKFNLTLNATERNDGIELAFAYAAQRFSGSLIEGMADDYLHLLEQIADRPATPLAALQLATTVARPRQSVAAARTEEAFYSIAQRVQETAWRTPQAPALHCEGQRMSYGELDGMANHIADRLGHLRVQPDECIGVCVERSGAMVAAILGIMKAGSAFVPLDPGYPQERLNFMLGNAGIRRVVADPNTVRKFPDLLEDFEVVLLGADDGDSVKIRSRGAHEPAYPAIHPDQLAYVIYTSGSTGKPKGVAVSHRALALHMDDFISTHGISEQDKVLHVSTINFDVALHEIFPVLIQGGSVEMRGPGAWDLETTSRHLIDEQVTFSRLPTAYWQQWLRELPAAEDLHHLRQITVGGEALNGDALRIWKSSPLQHIAVANLYGPTETTVACMYRQTEADDADNAIVPIGRAYPSRRVHVLDGDANALPLMVSGELCIGGDTLARGYLGRPDLTAEKFVPDPFGAYGGRLYRSGDVCRERSDGTIDYFGRRDNQVKLRGFRIELGEIENLLRSAPDIREAAVELVGEGADASLVAFVTGTVHKGEIMAYLRRQLPDYMVPSTFVALEKFPIMPNGKIDRNALLQSGITKKTREIMKPQSPAEGALFDIWREVLARDDFGVTDNFFDIGGNSLSALRVAAMAKNRGIRHFSLQALFHHPTISMLAEQGALESAGAISDVAVLRLNAPDDALAKLFVLPPSSGLAFEYRELAQALAGSVNVIGLQVPLGQEARTWPADFSALASYHIACMRNIQPQGPYRLLGWSLGGLLAVEIAHQLEALGERIEFIGIVDAKTPAQRAADRLGKNKNLQRREQANVGELDAFWQALQAQDGGMADFLREQHDPDRLAENIVLASNYLMALTSAGPDRRINADLHVWWSGDSARELQAGWDGTTRGQVRQVRRIDTTHRAIVRHAALAQDLQLLMTRLSNSHPTLSIAPDHE